MSNERGHYGSHLRIGADARLSEPSGPSGHPNAPWLLGGAGLVAVGLLVLGYTKRPQPRLTAHEKEVRSWEAEFPGLPWYADQVKDSRQFDMWERARDHWERSH